MSRLINITNATTLWCADQKEGIIFWSCATVISFVFGCPGAVLILLDMFQRRRKGTPFTSNDVFVSNLSVMDGLCLLFFLPEVYNQLHGFNVAFEAFISFLFSFILCGRPLFMTCISLDCYLAVVHPVTYRARKSLTPRVLMAVGVWTVTLTYGLYFATKSSEVLDDFTEVLFFALTLPVIGFCDVSILWTLKRPKPEGGDIHPQKKRALQIIISNLVVTFTSYFPPVIVILVFQFLSLDETTLQCLVVIPAMGIPLIGITVSLLLYLNNMGKLDWLKC